MIDAYRNESKIIGSLGATLPTWIRNICRCRVDGTPILVMEEQRRVLTKQLSQYSEKYLFCGLYIDILTDNSAGEIGNIIADLIEQDMKNHRKCGIRDFCCKMQLSDKPPKTVCLSCNMVSRVMFVIQHT